MNMRSLIRRLERLEAKIAPPTGCWRSIWQEWGESDEAVQARIRARIERGEMSENDQITIFRWPEPQGGWPPTDERWMNQNVHAVAKRAAERERTNSAQAGPSPQLQGGLPPQNPDKPIRTVHDGPDPTAPCPEYPP
jgi:hypothetical protein